MSGWAASIEAARRRIRGLVVETPLVSWENGLWLKCENAQVTGSFKLRGALNKVLGLSPADVEAGVVAASAGNHGQGVAYAAGLVGAAATIVVPDDAVRRKVAAIRRLGAEVVEIPGGYGAAEIAGRRLAQERGAVWVSPYNDADVIAGQGTIGLELLDQLPRGPAFDVYVPVSGGGLVSGIGLALEAEGGRLRVFAVQVEHAAYMRALFLGQDASHVVETPTMADGLSGPVEAGSMTIGLVRRVVEDVLLVSEAEVLGAMRLAWVERSLPMEASAAVALAAATRPGMGDRLRVVVVSGGNVPIEALQGLAGGEVRT
ncbi:MAG TPA: pyridoxal-phosphate dependent enzyme [Anaerolineales bacterium]|nr:pyridoxal-phosphate dependent enzyme [Anaerolineales bacterium]